MYSQQEVIPFRNRQNNICCRQGTMLNLIKVSFFTNIAIIIKAWMSGFEMF